MRASAATLVLALVCGLGFIGGCTSGEPPYPVEVLTSDEGLLGTWESVPQEGEKDAQKMVLEITAREMTVKEGRLDAGGMGADGKRKDREPRETRPGYFVKLTMGEPGKALQLMGVLFRAGSRQYMGLQTPPALIEQAGLGGWVIPVHRVVTLQREGDRMTAQAARVEVVWIPGVGILDGTGGTKDTVKTLMDDKAGPQVTTDIGRLLEVYQEASGNDAVWEKNIELRRIGSGNAKAGAPGTAR